MAKQKSVISFDGTFMGITQVNSRAYGDHVRAARGTHKPAGLNQAFKKSASEMVLSNLPAKMIKDALEPMRANFGGGMLWQELVSLFKKQYKDESAFDFTVLDKCEIHKRYPLSRLMTFANVQMQADAEARTASVVLQHEGIFQFKQKYINGYRLSVQAIFPVMEDKMAYAEVQSLPVMPIVRKAQEHAFTFTIPTKATVVLFAVKLEGYTAEAEDKSHATKGMRIEGVLRIE